MDEIKLYTVYKITNRINGKIYIGITQQEPEKRWSKGNGYWSQGRIGSAIKKWGWDNFTHEILEQKLSKEKALEVEKELIKQYNSTNAKSGYNIIGDGKLHCKHWERSVICLDTLQIYSSITEASKKLNIYQSGIQACCAGKQRTAKGLRWEYYSEYLQKVNNALNIIK